MPSMSSRSWVGQICLNCQDFMASIQHTFPKLVDSLWFQCIVFLLLQQTYVTMYSFEGDYRRKPQQNLAGASRRDEKAALLQHAHLERLKREQQRNRHNATVKIQAHVRSFIIRQAFKRLERCDFDTLQQTIGAKQLNINELTPFVKKLLFFYNHKYDGNRLIWLLQHVLKLQKEIKLQSTSSSEWLWRIRWTVTLTSINYFS